MERLQRVLSQRGVASRRRAEELIAEGRVRVDGQIVTELGTKVDGETQKIEVDGKLIPNPRRRYLLLHKPKGYITTTSDERGRDTVMDLISVQGRVVPVGRLDRNTEGLLLLTNDGEVANRVMHPRYELDKEYEALLDGHPPPGALDRLRRGVMIDGERALPSEVRPIRNTEDGTVVRVVIHEGRNRIVRRMFEQIGYPVLRLVRTRIGPLQLGNIQRGTWRDLTDGELRALREALHLTDEDVEQEGRQGRIEQVPSRPARPNTGQWRGPGGPRTQGDRPYRGPVRAGPPRRSDQDDPSGEGNRPPRRPYPRRDDSSPAPQRSVPRDWADRNAERWQKPSGGPRQNRDEDARGGGRRPRRQFDRDASEDRGPRRPAAPPRSGRPGGPGGPRRGPGGQGRTGGPAGPRRPGGPDQARGRDDSSSREQGSERGSPGGGRRPAGPGRQGGPGGRGGKPPVHHRDRRSGGGREEHGGGDRRPPD